MNRVYYRLLARILLYKFNKYSFQGRQKKAFKKRFMRPALRRANMKDFWSLHEEVKNGSNKYLRLTGSCVMPKLKRYHECSYICATLSEINQKKENLKWKKYM